MYWRIHWIQGQIRERKVKKKKKGIHTLSDFRQGVWPSWQSFTLTEERRFDIIPSQRPLTPWGEAGLGEWGDSGMEQGEKWDETNWRKNSSEWRDRERERGGERERGKIWRTQLNKASRGEGGRWRVGLGGGRLRESKGWRARSTVAATRRQNEDLRGTKRRLTRVGGGRRTGEDMRDGGEQRGPGWGAHLHERAESGPPSHVSPLVEREAQYGSPQRPMMDEGRAPVSAHSARRGLPTGTNHPATAPYQHKGLMQLMEPSTMFGTRLREWTPTVLQLRSIHRASLCVH